MATATALLPAPPDRPVPSVRRAPADPPARGAVRRVAWAWARLLGGAGILALLAWRVGTAAFLDGLRVISGPTLLAALGIGVVTTVFSAWRWCLVARALGLRLPLGNAVADYYRSLFLNSALPGGVLGDVHRAVQHGRDAGDVGRGVRAVVLERFAGQLVLVAAGLTVLVGQPSLLLLAGVDLGTVGQVTAIVLAVAGAGAVVLARLRRRGGARWRRALRTATVDVRRGLLARGNWPWIVLSSAVVLAGYLAMFLIAARAAGSSAPAARLLPLMVLALLAMALPVNVGGWGPREGFLAWAFGAAGLGAAEGLTVAVVYGLFAFAASLPGAGVLLVRWLARLRPARAPGQLAPNRSDRP